jgi:hypothetical protein
MATATKFHAFVEAVVEGKINLATDTLKVMLTNTAPVATNSVKADLTEISAGNGYTAGGNTATQSSSSQTTGTYKLVLNDPATWTATGSVGPFRYAVLYSDTATNKDLILFWDYGSSITLANGETFKVDFDPTSGVLTLA